MRPRRKKQTGSLDSLLDTMTNVVGILVILLVVTQLGMGDAVRRIGEALDVSAEVLEESEQKLASTRQQRISLRKQLNAMTSGSTAGVWRQMVEIGSKTATAEEQIKAEQAKRRAAREAAQAARQQIADNSEKLALLRQQIDEAEKRLAKLRAQLTETKPPPTVAAKVVYLPNPRSAAQGATPLTVICRGERVAVVNIEVLQERAKKRVDFLIRRGRLGRDPQAGIDSRKLIGAFNQNPIGDRDFELRLAVQGRVPYLVFRRKNKFGETASMIANKTSRFRVALLRATQRRAKSENHYLRFLVWPDSFEVYLAARQLASAADVAAGWRPQMSSDEFRLRLKGNLLCGPPPKPKPAKAKPTKPKPTKPATPKPQPPKPQPPKPPLPKPPPAKPAPPPRVAPSDEID